MMKQVTHDLCIISVRETDKQVSQLELWCTSVTCDVRQSRQNVTYIRHMSNVTPVCHSRNTPKCDVRQSHVTYICLIWSVTPVCHFPLLLTFITHFMKWYKTMDTDNQSDPLPNTCTKVAYYGPTVLTWLNKNKQINKQW